MDLKMVSAWHNGILAAFSLVVFVGQGYETYIESKVSSHHTLPTPSYDPLFVVLLFFPISCLFGSIFLYAWPRTPDLP